MIRRTRLAASGFMALTVALSGCAADPEGAGPEVVESAVGEEPEGALAEYSPAELARLLGGSVWRVDVEHCGGWGEGGGTGFSIGGGLIVTNAHVVEYADTVSVTSRNGETTFQAAVEGFSHTVDLAVLRAQGDTGPALDWAEPDLIHEGMPVVSLSYPQPLALFSVSAGHVNAIVREEGAPFAVISDELTDYGSSGGPLLDVNGRVVGLIAEFLGGSIPVGLSIAYPALEQELRAILEGERPYDQDCENDPAAGDLTGGTAILQEMCADRAFWACDQLYMIAPLGSAAYEFGSDCGGLAVGTDMYCVDLFGGDAQKVGDDPYLDSLLDECVSAQGGAAQACRLLRTVAPYSSDYALIAMSCAGFMSSPETCSNTIEALSP